MGHPKIWDTRRFDGFPKITFPPFAKEAKDGAPEDMGYPKV